MKTKIGVNQKFLDFPVDRVDANVYVADVNNKHMERTMILTDATAIAIINNDLEISDILGYDVSVPDNDYECLSRMFENMCQDRFMHADDDSCEIENHMYDDIVSEYGYLVDEAKQAA